MVLLSISTYQSAHNQWTGEVALALPLSGTQNPETEPRSLAVLLVTEHGECTK